MKIVKYVLVPTALLISLAIPLSFVPNSERVLIFGVVWLCGIVLYFVPSIMALAKHKQNAGAIVVLNLLLGWSIIGWFGALIWAASMDKPAAVTTA